ncbi:MAG: class I SAM-dependent RNA methyltransferase [Hyphomicrobiaceae bacterium]|nr:class I SAM-dependent RNA methyltransferase [Hyphomicrobiaceae bacterium]
MQPDHPDELQIGGLGAQGDGIADTNAGILYVPFALPGERVQPAGDALPRLLSAPSADRIPAPCRHFGVCGGCAAQHMGVRLYAEWKRDTLVTALRRRGLAGDVAPLHRVAPGTRRRAVLTARRAGERIVLGYHRRKSHDLVDIEECPVLLPAIVTKLPALRAIAAKLAAPQVRLTLLATAAGLDVAAVAGGQRPERAAVADLGRLATEHGLARVSVDGETLIERARPVLRMGEAEVAVPPAAFVQAVEESEERMRALVLAGLRKPKRVADLFCGVGTFTFALARQAPVLALDSDPAALAALADAARHAQGLKPIEAKVRDLFREPLSARELEPFDAVVFDPPRAGAPGQAQELARSKVETVIAVSCDPGTLARDTQILCQGGYVIASMTPIDQFVFSARVEAVSVLRRSAPVPTR